MKRKNIYIISLLCIIICCITIGFFSKERRLSEDEIEALREQYPICGMGDSVLGFRIPTSIETKIDRGVVYTFVYAEILDDYQTYYINISTGDEVFDEKAASKGFGVYEYYEYPIRVIEDVTGQYQEGDLLTIAGNMMLKDEKPDLQPGMKMIIPLKENDSKDTRNYFTEIGMYYVTEDGYAISAYDETELSRTARSGIKVKKLLKELQELMEEFQE